MCCGFSFLLRDRYDVIAVTSVEDAKFLLQKMPIGLVLADVDALDEKILAALAWVRKKLPSIPIVITYLYFGDKEMEMRAFEISNACILKPFRNDHIVETVERALAELRLN
jgi:DNA-binding NtrC family response regulator